MNTSYFAKYRGDMGCNIALKPIKGWAGKCYPFLYPTWPILSAYKNGGTIAQYVVAYNNHVLLKLNPETVFNDLKDYTLLCYEKPGDFCHRRLIANWLEDALGVIIPELTYE